MCFPMKTNDYRRAHLGRRVLKVAVDFSLVAVGAAAYFSAHVASPVLRARTGGQHAYSVSEHETTRSGALILRFEIFDAECV